MQIGKLINNNVEKINYINNKIFHIALKIIYRKQ